MRSRSKGVDEFDRLVGRSIIFLGMFAVMVKLTLDFIQLFVTGHTTNFLWVSGDLMANNNNGDPTVWHIITFLFICATGMAVLGMMSVAFNTGYEYLGRLYRFLSKYEIRKKDEKK